MSYIDGFVIPVAKANRQRFIDFANYTDTMFMEMGATRVLECWADDVPEGKLTDFRMAVKASEDEDVIFAWIEWPDKATRDAAMAKMMDPENTDPRMDQEKNPVPFDGKRMIFGGFENIVSQGSRVRETYVDGFVSPVPAGNGEAYRKMAQAAAPIWHELGAISVTENWEDEVPDGKLTDFRRAVSAQPGEKVVFSWIEYPDKATRDQANKRFFEDGRFAALGEIPFDNKRMIFGGFVPVVTLEK